VAFRRLAALGFLLAAWGTAAVAQPPAALRVTVFDPSGLVIAGATVTVVRGDGTTASAATNDQGEAVFAGLTPGRYTIRAEAPGFDAIELIDQNLRAGTTRRTLTLPLAAVFEELTVSRDRREAGTDPRGDAFTTSLTERDIADLPDDPDEMAQAIEQMAGPGAVMRVNGFRGGALPPKSQIREIRFRRNAFAAENHEAGFISVDIVTRPGLGAWRASANLGFRDAALNARNAFAPVKVPEQLRRGLFTLDGPLWRNRTSLALSVNGVSAYDSQTIVAELPTGSHHDVVRRPSDRASLSARVEHALSKTHALKVEIQRNTNDAGLLGVGGIDLADRAYARGIRERVLRLSESGSLGRRMLNEARLGVTWLEVETTPASRAPAIVVQGAFASGGAQREGTRASRSVEIADNFDIAVGRHAVRTGLLVEGQSVDSAMLQNAGGTFTFASLDDFRAGRAATYTRRTGDPSVAYSLWQFAWYAQDDIRLRKSLTLSLGLRHEWQSHVDRAWNLAPRVGLAWSPFENGRTTFRGGAGVFYDWYEAETYEQTLQVDGTRQQDLVVRNPGWPDPFDGGQIVPLPPGVVRAARDLKLPMLRQVSFGVERLVGQALRVNATYQFRDGRSLLRARNVNAPGADGTRPDPSAGNIIEIASTGRSRQHALIAGFNARTTKPRLFVGAHYFLSRSEDDGNGPLALPADSRRPDEWGPAADDIRHRVGLFANVDLPKGFRLGVNLRAESARPYTITTGRDDNGDTIFTDRPAGVGRNSARGEGFADLMLRLAWQIGFGERGQSGAPGGPGGGPQIIRVRPGDGDGSGPMPPMGTANHRVTAELYVQALNALNATRFTGYNGVLTSPVFGQPTGAMPARRVEVGTRVMF
jgi:hypothetical protein